MEQEKRLQNNNATLLLVLQHFRHPNRMGGAHSLHDSWQAKKHMIAGSIGQIALNLDRAISREVNF